MARTLTNLGPWLAERMHQKDITRKEVADACGVDPTSVSRWITKGVQPGYECCEPLANLLDEPVATVLALAGYGQERPAQNVAPIKREPDLLSVELDRMLDPSSPLTDADKDRVRLLVDAQMAPYRSKMRTRRKVG